MSTKGDHSAHPVGNQGQYCPQEGLTKREYFAAAAMQGLLAHGMKNLRANSRSETCGTAIARNSALFADELIAELNKEGEDEPKA